MKEQFEVTLENSKNYTLAVANAMPEKDYHFKPAGAGWDFGELLNHIAYGIEWWESNFIKGDKIEWNPPTVKEKKKEITGLLEKAYASLSAAAAKTKWNDNSIQGFHATIDHITHHRGQAVLFLRCKGIEPPEYVY